MTERERLVELLNDSQNHCAITEFCDGCVGMGKGYSCFIHYQADYLLANGVIAPPCKAGDTVYVIPPWWSREDSVSAYQITNLLISNNKKGVWTKKYRAMWLVNGKIVEAQINFGFDEIGKTVFFTREEAEAALEERSKG